MTHLEAVFENGVFRPLQPVRLAEQQRVTVSFDEEAIEGDPLDQVHFSVSEDRWKAFCDALDAPPKVIPALRKLFMETGVADHGRNAG